MKVNKRPVHVRTKGKVVSIAAGYAAVYFVKEDGSLWSFGWNGYGQLGDGTTELTWKPVQAVGLENVVAVFGGEHSTLAITAQPEDVLKYENVNSFFNRYPMRTP